MNTDCCQQNINTGTLIYSLHAFLVSQNNLRKPHGLIKNLLQFGDSGVDRKITFELVRNKQEARPWTRSAWFKVEASGELLWKQSELCRLYGIGKCLSLSQEGRCSTLLADVRQQRHLTSTERAYKHVRRKKTTHCDRWNTPRLFFYLNKVDTFLKNSQAIYRFSKSGTYFAYN